MCLVGIICFRQSDLKSLVAYSSIAHMSLVMASIFSFSLVSTIGILGILIAHGLCSSGLFFGIQCIYKISGSRRILLKKGLIIFLPIFRFFWFFLCISNASAPPTLNLLREFFLIFSILDYSLLGSIFCFLSVFLGGLFRIYLYVLINHKK